MVFQIQLKKQVAGNCILGIVITKLGYWKEFDQIILLKFNKSSEIGIYDAVLLLCLAICLKVESGKKFILNTKKVAKQ